ncbi:hypothetical protein Q5X37_14675 [Acinetobacter baumannii]|uniref:hypothetical protein n=1 Tax=Acinetobacter baumannii TaxID=470 RepID=UPI000DE77C4B|nr:hypothetical protein [Acinetobacter baumannii]MDC5106521.1 hypothetical protein [Acinetobacter baumannii]MDC5456025.1 hypothetical protein [Acinetobacter baumannii]MDO7374233.1 hypothetical protein [Acinetobacter baumannii]SSS77463.1 Uncharacterised protein [Acinetobacter baumannii]
MINFTAITTVGGVLVPLIVAYISSRHNFKKHPRLEFSESIEAAKEFDAIVTSTESQLVKERVAQKLVMKKNINFLEAQYFYSYVDMEFWVERYVDVRKYIEPIIDENNKIVDLKNKYTMVKGITFLCIYIFFAILAMIPLMFLKHYLEILHQPIDTIVFLIKFNLIIWPILFGFIALGSLHKANKISDAYNFLKHFQSDKIKIKE